MRQRFVAKSRRNFSFILKIFLFIILGIFTLYKIMSFKLFESNSNLIMHIMEQSNHLIETELTCNDKMNDAVVLLTNSNIKKPVSLFQNNYIYENINDETDSYDIDTIFFGINNYLNNIDISNMVVNNSLPRVYIYNTHQTEEYVMDNYAVHNLEPNVLTAAYMLESSLEKKGINTIVETGNISEYLNNNNLNYDDSYIASRYYLEQAITKYPSVEIFIDLHRDALTHDAATIQNDGKNYAKILFVVGIDHDNYQPNLDFSNELNNLFLNNYPFLTRGVLTKTGPLVNGVYNQDLSSRVILLEVGGHESTLEEVSNTIDLISEILFLRLGDGNV